MRLLIVVIASVACLWIIWSAIYFGLSRLLGRYSLIAADLSAAEAAVKLAPSDAEAYGAKASVLGLSTSVEESAATLERAIALRPDDYFLWLQLALLRDRDHDSAGAFSAFNEAVRLAPFYAEPRWQRGNLLLRMGHYDEAFADLSQAAGSNPELFPTLIDLAWGLSKGDVALTEQLAQIDNKKKRITFAKFLAQKGKGAEAMAQFRAAGAVPEDIKRELVEQLINKNAFKEAFDVWRASQESSGGKTSVPSIYDGGFEGPLSFDDAGFSWRIPRKPAGATMSLDSSQPHSGSKDLRIEFAGESNPGVPLISQLVLIEPSARYKINFAARSQDVVSGGLPVVVASDAGPGRKILGKSASLPKGTSEWQVFSFEFTATPATPAVVLTLQREACTSAPCPVFGAISLDSFSIEQLK
ncbi:MAG TPA: hypothetical protein DCK93_09990 [Blastocatellia bacterium]|nr:hypothetical protein [Blastocatellia bacterium]HAF23221.1 hypothetical protein [Blastocatellia bacterium]